jgi:NADPH-dependent glutamate synthase beta subunit-like oxidoreductase
MQGGRMTGVPGEDAEGVQTGVDFMRKINLDPTIRLSGRTVVVGGGNVAVDVARTAVRAGSDSVTMLCLESVAEMPAAPDEVAEAKEEGITVHNGWGPKEVLTENGKVKGVIFKRCTAVFDADHRFNPQYDEDDTMTIECENILLSIGQSVQWGDLLAGSKVELNRNGTAKADPVTYQTAEPDIFVGGDVYTGPKFAIDAIAAGREGMVSINRFVHPGQSLTIGRDRREFIEFDRDDIFLQGYDNADRQRPGVRPGVATQTFDDLRLPLTEEQAKIEAGRCLGCGATIVDLNKCIGCGLCTTRCEFDAIHLTRDIPAASDMHTAEEMISLVGPYALKRMGKILKKKITGKSEYPTEQE